MDLFSMVDGTMATICACVVMEKYLRDLFESNYFGPPSPTIPYTVLFSKAISVCHAFTLALLASLYLLGKMSDETWIWLQFIPIGYCIYDTLNMFGKKKLYEQLSKLMVLHHILFIFVAMYLVPKYPYYMAIAYLSEWSNVPLHLTYIVAKTGYLDKSDQRYETLGVITTASFLLLRVMNFLNLMIKASQHGFLYFTIGFAFTGMNVYWFIKILKFLYGDPS